MADAGPITFWNRKGVPGFPYIESLPEDDAETFLKGVPVFLDSDGNIQEVPDGFGGSELVYGVSVEAAHNLTTAGTAELGNEHGSPPNQPNAKSTAIGSPTKDGSIKIYRDLANTYFRCALDPDETYTSSLVEPATRYELDKTSNGYWSVDSSDTGTAAKHAVHIRGVDPNNSAFVIIQFAAAATAA